MLSVVRGRWTIGDDMPEINLRYAIIPLYLVGKLFCLNAFTYSPGWVDHSGSKDDTRLRGDYDDVDGNRSAPPRRSFEWTKNRTESRANNAFGNANHYDNICVDNHYRNGIITASGDTVPTAPTATNNRSNKKNSVVLWTTALRNHMHLLKPGSQRSLKFSIAGIVHVVAFCTAYGSYHVYSTLELFSKTKRPELVRMIIDLINQYAGCCLVVTLVSAALVNQHSLMKLINTLFEIDDLLMSRLNIAARSGRWLLHITTLFIASIVIKSVIGTAFYSTSDEDPNTSSNLLMFRLIPRVMCLVSELQYIAYVLLIKDRYVALKQTLSGGTETPSKANIGTVKWKENSQTANRLAETHHPKGFAVHHDGTSVAAGGDCLPTNVTNQSMTSKLDGCQHRLNLQAARTNQLRHIYEIYLRLRQTIRLTNRSFGVRNLILILYQFVTVVQMGYMVCMLWVRKIDDPADKQNRANLLVTVIFAGCFLAEILAICAYSHSTMNEDYGTRQLIFANLHNEIDDTGSGLSANPSIRFNLLDQRFDCLGLFDVNLSLFYGIVGAMTTYLIILIQFGHLGSLR